MTTTLATIETEKGRANLSWEDGRIICVLPDGTREEPADGGCERAAAEEVIRALWGETGVREHARAWGLRWMATDEQIRTLSTEAGEAGDLEQVALCDNALAGDDEARAECAKAIRAASAAAGS